MGGADRSGMTKWLEERNISLAGFERLVKGQFEPRLHLPLIAQERTGQVLDLLEDSEGTATGLKILSKAGELVTADRSCLFVYSHWMGKSDLAYSVLSGEFPITHLIYYCSIVLLA